MRTLWTSDPHSTVSIFLWVHRYLSQFRASASEHVAPRPSRSRELSFTLADKTTSGSPDNQTLVTIFFVPSSGLETRSVLAPSCNPSSPGSRKVRRCCSRPTSVPAPALLDEIAPDNASSCVPYFFEQRRRRAGRGPSFSRMVVRGMDGSRCRRDRPCKPFETRQELDGGDTVPESRLILKTPGLDGAPRASAWVRDPVSLRPARHSAGRLYGHRVSVFDRVRLPPHGCRKITRRAERRRRPATARIYEPPTLNAGDEREHEAASTRTTTAT